jgi:hypothetical protein
MPWNRAGLSGAFLDRIVETKGVSALLFFFISCDLILYLQFDYVDKKKAQHHGKPIELS